MGGHHVGCCEQGALWPCWGADALVAELQRVIVAALGHGLGEGAGGEADHHVARAELEAEAASDGARVDAEVQVLLEAARRRAASTPVTSTIPALAVLLLALLAHLGAGELDVRVLAEEEPEVLRAEASHELALLAARHLTAVELAQPRRHRRADVPGQLHLASEDGAHPLPTLALVAAEDHRAVLLLAALAALFPAALATSLSLRVRDLELVPVRVLRADHRHDLPQEQPVLPVHLLQRPGVLLVGPPGERLEVEHEVEH